MEHRPHGGDRDDAIDLLSIARWARLRARTRAGWAWFPLGLFGILILLAIPFYQTGPGSSLPGSVVSWSVPLGSLALLAGPYRGAMNVAIFWVSAIPIGYAVTGLYRMIHARRVGAVSPSAAYFVLGAFCFLVMIAAACLGTRWLGMGLSEIFERGMLPIVVITLPLVLLAHGHRSWALLSTVLVILGLAVAVDIYDLENLFGATDPAMAAVVPGLALVVSSLVLGVGPRFIRSWPPANAAQHRPIQTGRQAMTYSVQALDDTVHQRNRLAILSVLHELTTADFRFLRESLEMTDGNLGRHLVVLETAGFVNIAKGYEGKRPRTTVTITTLGRRALNSEIKALKEFVAQVEASPQKVRSRRGARPEGVIRTAQV